MRVGTRGSLAVLGVALLGVAASASGAELAQSPPTEVNGQITDLSLRPASDGHVIVARDVEAPRGSGPIRTLTSEGFAADIDSADTADAVLSTRTARVPIRITRARVAGDGSTLIMNIERLTSRQVAALATSPRGAAATLTPGRLRGRDGPAATAVGQANLAVDVADLARDDGPPAILVTFHGGSGDGAQNNVWALDADGDVVTDTFLAPPKGVKLDELRDMQFADDGSLFVVNANKNRNEVLRFAAPPDGGLPWRMVGTTPYSQGLTAANPGLAHPYGVALSPDEQTLFASSQDTSVVTRLGGPTAAGPSQGVPGAVGSAWTPLGSLLAGTLVPGSVEPSVKIPAPRPNTISQSDGGLKAPRGIALSPDGRFLYAADDSGAGGVRRYIAASGEFLGYAIDPATADRPVGVITDSSGVVWATSKGADSVQTFNPLTGGVATVITKSQFAATGVTLDGPAGLVVVGRVPEQVVFVANRKTEQIVCADLALGTAAVLVDNLPDEPEQIELLPGASGACLTT